METNKSPSIWNGDLSPLEALRREIDRLFDDSTEIEETEDHYLLTVEMPGIRKDEIGLQIVGNQILISAEHHSEETSTLGGSGQQEDETWFSEQSAENFHRRFSLPTGVDVEKIQAHYQDGILKVNVPKTEASKPRRIPITEGRAGGGSQSQAV